MGQEGVTRGVTQGFYGSLEGQDGDLIFFLRFYLFIHERQREREREAEIQAEGEAGSMQGAQRGTRSWDSRITPWAEGGAKPLSHLGCPKTCF